MLKDHMKSNKRIEEKNNNNNNRKNNTLHHRAKEALHIHIKDPSLNRNIGKVRIPSVICALVAQWDIYVQCHSHIC